jgi:ubiquinone/menaquinone biosynthesis C-methylase UbiE
MRLGSLISTIDKHNKMKWKEDSQSFDRVAALYDRYRPGYPLKLIADIIRISGISPGERILEIGCGTGKATQLFAEKGYPLVCLEPGQNLLAIAAKNLAAYPQVTFVQTRFEDWESAQEKFNLVISAQAYHWVPENVRYVKTARVLKSQGYLAAFWNMYPGMDSEIRTTLDRIYRQRAPDLVKLQQPVAELIERIANSLRQSRLFDKVVVKEYPWSVRYSTSEYLGLLNTYSDHLRLSEQRRRGLLREIAAVIDQKGGYIERPYLAVVYLAKRNACT